MHMDDFFVDDLRHTCFVIDLLPTNESLPVPFVADFQRELPPFLGEEYCLWGIGQLRYTCW